MQKPFSIANSFPSQGPLPLQLRATPDVDLETCARRMQSESNESPAALEGSDTAPRIVQPGDAWEYLHSAMVGWRPLRTDVS